MAFYTAHPRPKTGERCPVLSRTNLALFEHALGLRATGIPFSLQGNIMASAMDRGNQVWARGLEYDRVYIDPDIAASLSKPEAVLNSSSGDKANIAYVAFTRAIRELHLPPDFKDILTPAWQAALKRYEPAQHPRISHAPQPKPEAGRPRSPSSPRSAPSTPKVPEPPRKKRFKVGYRVRISHGTGTVVEINGEKYLVDLDGQTVWLWEKAYRIRKI